MDLHPGTHLGAYEVIELLGQGGMGSVYRATDTRLGRQVAIKIVRPPFAEDADRIARFTREARLLASLSHPHIAAIHDIEEFEGVRFLILELVPGQTLAQRLSHGPMPVHEALTVAAQIAAAVEAAHERGIIHRDLKPANIKVTPDGCVKVLDFGLAKALEPESGPQAPVLSDSPTVAVSGTVRGTILGTAAYMSPEQARGQEVDKRTDIWAFGCVLFDMLTGKEAFACDTLPDTIAAILTRDPDWARLPADLPVPIRCLLRRALHKDPQRRLRDIGDARIELEDALSGQSEAAVSTGGARGLARAARRHWLGLAASLVAVAVVTAAAVWSLKPSTVDRSLVQFSVPLPAGARLDGLDFPAIALSPAGTHVIFVASRGGPPRLFLRALSSLEVQPIDGTEGALGPFFSPDGQWVAFFADGKLKKVQVTGGPVRTICDAPVGFGGVWSPDGTIIYAPDNGSAIWQVSADGGAPRAITKLDASRGEFSHRWPELLPGAREVLYTVGTQGSWDDAEIVAQALGSEERHGLVQGGTQPRYLPDGRLLYVRASTVYAVPLDLKALRATAGATPILAGVLESIDGAMQLSTSRAGSVAYLSGGDGAAARSLVWVDRQGNVQPLASPERAYASPRVAPDGRSLAVTITGADRNEVWTYDIARNALAQVTYEGGDSPVWTSDGARIIFSASRNGPPSLFWKRADGSGPEERLTNDPRAVVPGSSSPDGRTVALVESDPSARRDILLLNGENRTSRPFFSTPANEMAPAFSPDGSSIAYVSDESGRNEVYVASLKDPKRRTHVSADGGTEPVWRRDGRELFFRSGDKMMAAVVTGGPSPSAGPARVLFEGTFDTGAAARPAYDVSADGARFLMVASSLRERPGPELRVILGWAASRIRP